MSLLRPDVLHSFAYRIFYHPIVAHRELPIISESSQVRFLWNMATETLRTVPLKELVTDAFMKQQIFHLTDSLMLWTLHVNQPKNDKYDYSSSTPYEWNLFFGSWLAELALYISLEEAQQHVLNPVRASWSVTPKITEMLMLYYVDRHLGEEIITSNSDAAWQEMCNWILDSSEVSMRADGRHFGTELYHAVSQILFVGYGRPLFKEEWTHIQHFRPIIEKCVNVIGHHFDLYADLLVMLRSIGKSFLPEPALSWLETITGKVSDLKAFWIEHNNGIETSHLLKRMWDEHETYIRSNKDSLQRYSHLADLLVAAGVPLASQLQQQLEKRN